jgi:hypothetical protein
MKRQQYRPWGVRNVKPERRWAKQKSDSEHDLGVCILTEENKKKGY